MVKRPHETGHNPILPDARNFPYVTVSDRADADPYAQEREVWELPDYSGGFDDALTLAPPGFELVLRQAGPLWKAAFKHVDLTYLGERAWKESASPVRAIARAALAAWLGG